MAVAALAQLGDRAHELGIRSMRLVIDEDNLGSRRTALRAGYVEVGPGAARVSEGVAHETVVYVRDF